MIERLEKEKIQAVHDEDLQSLLESLNVLTKIRQGEIRCKFCDEVITLNNLHAIFPQSGSIKFVCDKIPCVKALLNSLRKGEIAL